MIDAAQNGRARRVRVDLGAASAERLRRAHRDRAHGARDQRVELGRQSCRFRRATRSRWRNKRCRLRRSAKVGFTLGLGPSHHWIVEDMLGLSYDRPAQQVRDYLEVLNVAFAGPGPVDVENEGYRIHNPLDVTDITPTPILARRARAGDAARRRRARVRHDPLDGRRTRDRRSRRPRASRRPRPTRVDRNRGSSWVPVALCRNDEVDDARARANRVLGHAEFSPNYQRLLEHGDATDVPAENTLAAFL